MSLTRHFQEAIMTQRTADYPILPGFTERWSPRAFGPQEISVEQLFTVFEAARWSPSCMNVQPWRFAYALRGDAHWDAFVSALVPANQIWSANASALIFIISDTQMDYKGDLVPNPSHGFDAGAAWMSLTLQAASMGLITHGMAGFDPDRARTILNINDNFHINVAVAIGYQGDKASLPEAYQSREAPSDRRPVEASAFHGSMRY
jgi:nitroreductase